MTDMKPKHEFAGRFSIWLKDGKCIKVDQMEVINDFVECPTPSRYMSVMWCRDDTIMIPLININMIVRSDFK